MSKVPSVSYPQIVAALERDKSVVVRQRGGHIRLEEFEYFSVAGSFRVQLVET